MQYRLFEPIVNLVMFGHVVFEICECRDRQTNRHTDTKIAILRAPHAGEVTIAVLFILI